MKIIFLVFLMVFTALCGAQEIDFLTVIKNSPETSKALGIQKLNAYERATLNTILNRAYQLGFEQQKQPNNQGPVKPVQQGDRHAAANPVFITKIDEDNEDILKLANGAVVEITNGFLGFVGFQKDAVLFKKDRAWKIWIEDKKTFNCDIHECPVVTRTNSIG